MRLFYYTGPEYIEDNLKNRRLKLSRFGVGGKLNDPFELSSYNLQDKAFRAAHRAVTNKFADKLAFLCLSQTGHSPLMWAHYAKNHQGVCLELEIQYEPLFKIKYEEERLFPGITLENHKQYLNRNNIKIIMGTKAKDWSYEKEWRMQVPLESEAVCKDSSGLHFLPFQNRNNLKFNLGKVYVGYRCKIGIKNLQRVLKGYRHKVEVIQTRPAFGDFRVVEQKEKKFWNWDAIAQDQTCPAEQALYGGDA